MDRFEGKNIWIIGASSGIGHALSKELLQRGAKLILSARNTDKLETLKAGLTGDHYVCPVDIRNIESVQNALKFEQEKCGHIDSIINLAALYEPASIKDMNIEKARLLVDVNITGSLNLIYAALPVLKYQSHGQLVLCGSVAGYRGLPNGQPYSATKAAIINLAESLKIENPDLDIKLINPGFVRTPLTDKNDFEMPMMIEPEEAAKAIADGLLKKSFEIHFPKKFTILMKLLRLIPNAIYFKIAGKFARG